MKRKKKIGKTKWMLGFKRQYISELQPRLLCLDADLKDLNRNKPGYSVSREIKISYTGKGLFIPFDKPGNFRFRVEYQQVTFRRKKP